MSDTSEQHDGAERGLLVGHHRCDHGALAVAKHPEAIAPDVTRLTVRESSYPTAEARDMSSRGLEECLDKLVATYP